MSNRGSARRERLEAWLAAGGVVLTASERTARALAAEFHAARVAEGRVAWATPALYAWDAWTREQWRLRNAEGRMLLNDLQEQALWLRVMQGRGQQRRQQNGTGDSDLDSDLESDLEFDPNSDSAIGLDWLFPARLAQSAMRAGQLLSGYAAEARRASGRRGWQGDAAVFSRWLEAFDAHCRREGLASAARIPLELAEHLAHGAASPAQDAARPALLLVGFDRILKSQRALLDAWGSWQHDELEAAAEEKKFWVAPDRQSETEACLDWLRRRLVADPNARLLVVATGLDTRRGELERALQAPGPTPDADPSRKTHPPPILDFEFSMGVPLAQLGLARAALLLLRWLKDPLDEPELDWLIGSGSIAASAQESFAMANTMLEARRRGQQRSEWRIEEFLAAGDRHERQTPAWAARLQTARLALLDAPERRSPMDWAAAAEALLQTVGWPGYRPLTSLAFQALQRWHSLLNQAASLGFDGTQMPWPDFVATLAQTAAETVFAAESRNAAIQITGPMEAAGQYADGIWFLGASEEEWPLRGQPHPLLPAALQREAQMPHASPQADWALAQQATQRLLASADQVVFSFPRRAGEVEARPSRLILEHVGAAESWSGNPFAPPRDRTERFEDWTQIPFPHPAIGGGAATLTWQSLCPFQAFALARLGMQEFAPAEAGLSPLQRGQLLHAVLHRIWGGAATGGLRTLAELLAVPSLDNFVERHVSAALEQAFDPARKNALPNRFPIRYLQLEAARLTQLVTAWLEFERKRLPFTVEATEVQREATVAGLTLRLRLDRLDTLADGTRLVVDYKTGNVAPSDWQGERPEDLQLPLYAAFAAPDRLQGLLFARVRPGETQFAGRVRDANATLIPGLSGNHGLIRNPLTDADLQLWHRQIEQLGQDFLAGKAEVDPKEPGKTCKNCPLPALCRVHDGGLATDFGTEEEDAASLGGFDA